MFYEIMLMKFSIVKINWIVSKITEIYWMSIDEPERNRNKQFKF